MKLFGILLIVVNLAVGAGFVYLATQDWKGRQTINAAGLRHVLLLQGLPVEPPSGPDPDGFDPATDERFEVEMGVESIKVISKKLLASYFAANTASGSAPPPAATTGTEAPPPPVVVPGKVPLSVNTAVTHQLAEVKRVQAVIKAELGKAELTPADKIALLKGWVLYQAEDLTTRNRYLDLIAKGDVAALEAALDARFAAALAKPQATDSPSLAPAAEGAPPPNDRERLAKSAEWRSGAPLDETQRRMNIAHLLIHLDPDANWQKRVMVVVGLRRYVKALTVQVLRFTDMIQQVERYIPDDQASFAREETVLREQATQHQERAKAVAEIRASFVEKKTAKEDQVSREKTQLKELTDQLTKVKSEVDELLVKQTDIEKQLFEIQREVGLTLEDVYRLEALLAAVERDRAGLPPKAPK